MGRVSGEHAGVTPISYLIVLPPRPPFLTVMACPVSRPPSPPPLPTPYFTVYSFSSPHSLPRFHRHGMPHVQPPSPPPPLTVMACPMCKRPVTLGGGIAITKGGPVAEGLGLK